LIQIDLKNKKKANIKNKSLESDKILKSKKKTNIDKNNSIDIDFRNSKKTNIKKISKNNNIKNIDLSNF